ncbi:MAG TPA: type II and III secretion system protein family protein [Phycisphaerae bacterium]|nr:type II and III secretion system protein family protein [Phycisphaerae bacterium]
MKCDRDGQRRIDWATRSRGAVWLSAMLTGWVVLLAGRYAAGQQPVEGGQAIQTNGDLVVQVREVATDSRRLTVSMNKSLILDTNLPIRRASVTAPEVADVVVLSPKKLLVTGKTFGATQLILWTSDQQQELFDLAVVFDKAELEKAIRRTAPLARVRVEPMLGTLVLDGAVPDPASADRVMDLASIYSQKVHNQMRVAGVQQVLLRCTVAEVSKSALRRLGVNGWMAGDHFQDAFVVSQIGGINPINIGASADSLVTRTIPFLTGEDGIPITTATTFSLGFPSIEMQLFVQALRENGLLRILAEPNLMAISGQTATFLAGGEFPVPIPQDSDTITIEYKEYGVRLNFTPTVVGGQMVRLRVAPEVSEPDFSTAVQFAGFVIPGITQRRAETTVELGSGQTVAIAGLLSERIRGVTQRLPGVGDLPIIGALFSSVEYQKSNTELMILVTPELAEAMNPDQATTPLPGEYMVEPNDYELFGLGALEGRVQSSAEGQPVSESDDTPAEAEPAAQASPVPLEGPWGLAESGEAE